MLNCFPQSHKTNFDAMVHGYRMACDAYQPGAIIETARQFMKGRVESQSRDFAPTPAAFADEAKRVNGQFNGLERKSAEEQRTRRLEALVKTNRISHQPEKTPESKARVAAMVKGVKGMGSGVPNFNTGSIEERKAKAEKYNREKAESAESLQRMKIERAQARG